MTSNPALAKAIFANISAKQFAEDIMVIARKVSSRLIKKDK